MLDLTTRMRRAWQGRISGCQLGKPVEVLSILRGHAALTAYLDAVDALPLRDYIAFRVHPDVQQEWCRGGFARSAPDDDVNYTFLALLLLERFGAALSTEDVARTWLRLLPVGQTYTAERAAYGRLLARGHERFADGHALGFDVTECADNRYNDWIGAQIRADLYGWVTPGRPALAAELARRDAALSHRGDGIHGAVFVAALGAALGTEPPDAALAHALAEIPAQSRAHEAAALGRSLAGRPDGAAVIRERHATLSPVHTINNLAIVVWSLYSHRSRRTSRSGRTRSIASAPRFRPSTDPWHSTGAGSGTSTRDGSRRSTRGPDDPDVSARESAALRQAVPCMAQHATGRFAIGHRTRACGARRLQTDAAIHQEPAMSRANKVSPSATPGTSEPVDVLIVGAGISGVGGAYHLKQQCPGTRFLVLDALAEFGGTWRTHRYPGIRSDSDLYTFGYRFKPWTGPPVATGEEILRYLREVIEENDLARHIRYRHRIDAACWSSETNLWTVDVTRTDTGEHLRFTTRFLWMCQGYYRHATGHTPEWKDMHLFRGRIVHPQTWPEDLDVSDQHVLVIGSGATAATLVPAIAAKTRHTTMLQRSATYFLPAPNRNELADTLRQLAIDETWIHEIVRRKILHDQHVLTKLCLEHPDFAKEELLKAVRAYLPEEMVQAQFTPKYRPWQQRLAYVPDGDLFQGIVAGKASVITGEIDRFTEKGVLLHSGEELLADIIVTATGFDISVLGDIAFTIDGKPLNLADTVTYRGMMFSGVPNLLWIFGYFRASWTLRADLLGDFVCRLLTHMEQKGAKRVSVALRREDRDMPLLPWMDPGNFNPGYLMRSMHLLPKRGDKPEWQHTQDYWREKTEIPAIDLDAEEFVYA